MSTVDEAFIYTPLQPGQIRVLLPHIQADGRVHWSLANEQLLDPSGNRTSLEYDALSYTWGDSTPKATKFPVVCNDQQLLVHHNLNTALPFLARRNSPLPIWIDAVCINQPDKDEKFHQIQMMFQIYQCAAQVWVWLGPGNDQSGTVVARLHELPVETDNDIKNQTAFFKNNQNVPWLNSSETWSSFYDLVDNAWYTRLWVFQEVAFAKKVRVLLGAHEVAWATLKTVVKGSQSGWLFAGHDELRPGELVLRGQLFDEVERVFDWYTGSSDGFEEMKLVHRWIEDTEVQVCSHLLTKEKQARNYSDNDSMKAAYWDTLNTSLTNVNVPPVLFQTVDDLKNSWEQVTLQIETLALLDETPFAATPNSEDMYDVMKQMAGAGRISALMGDQRLFITTSGRLGHAFPNVSLGDQICIFSDAQVVHIVRPRSAEHTYELVGPAYVHGMMHGEVAKLNIVEQDVTLV
ncbi:hypothetical protein E8E12_001247 [Didymella heteroderae]|uniref:Heterokaryon incompatibility domain-containing protein n=1 Tax=Didymella heteroderae TaxID=1769908 RepID=A0A9P4WG43_9PLEO|nr:hypothetical protein E8E12_001247 [Didymella heteroderae]